MKEEKKKIKPYKKFLKIEGDLEGRFCAEHNEFWTEHKEDRCELCDAPVVDSLSRHCIREKCFNGEECGFSRSHIYTMGD